MSSRSDARHSLIHEQRDVDAAHVRAGHRAREREVEVEHG